MQPPVADLVRIADLIRLAAETAKALSDTMQGGQGSKIPAIARRIEAAAEELAQAARDLDQPGP